MSVSIENRKWFLLPALALWLSAGAAAIDCASLRFYLPFEGDLQPRIAGANTQIQFVKGEAKDAQLVEGRRGRGLKVTPLFTLRYLTRNSFAPKEGTLAFWLKPVGWSGVNHFRHFLIAQSDQVIFEFYMYYGNPWLYVADPARYKLVGGPNWQFAFDEGAFPEDQWTFLAGTFKPGQQAFYINGKLIIRCTDGLIEPEFIEKGNIEIPAGDQVLDEIMVFDRTLSEQEIFSLYRANLP